MRIVDVTVSLETLSHGPQQETRTVTQYDTVDEARQDLGDARLLKLLNAKLVSVTRAQINAHLNSATYARLRS